MPIEIPQLTLSDGLTLPAVGFGTYRLNGAEGVHAMLGAIDAGYRLLDSAFNYENEGAVGEAVRRSSVPREELRVTSKLPGRHHRLAEATAAIRESLYRAGLDYYDLYLIHWPNPKENLYVEAWQALIQARQWGLVRSIGVCNFLPEHIERLSRRKSSSNGTATTASSPRRGARSGGNLPRCSKAKSSGPSPRRTAGPCRRSCCAGISRGARCPSRNPLRRSASARTSRCSTSS